LQTRAEGTPFQVRQPDVTPCYWLHLGPVRRDNNSDNDSDDRKFQPVHLPSLAGSPPGRRENAIAVAVAVTSGLTLLLLSPFARVGLPRVEAFIPAYEAAPLGSAWPDPVAQERWTSPPQAT